MMGWLDCKHERIDKQAAITALLFSHDAWPHMHGHANNNSSCRGDTLLLSAAALPEHLEQAELRRAGPAVCLVLTPDAC